MVNKLTSVFHASVLLLIMNFVITLSKYYFDNVITKFIVSNGTDAGADPENSERGGRVPPPNKNCNYNNTQRTFRRVGVVQKRFENTRKKGGAAPSARLLNLPVRCNKN